MRLLRLIIDFLMTIKDLIILALIILVFFAILHLNDMITNFNSKTNNSNKSILETESETVSMEINQINPSKVANIAVDVNQVPLQLEDINEEEMKEEFVFEPYTYLPSDDFVEFSLSDEF